MCFFIFSNRKKMKENIWIDSFCLSKVRYVNTHDVLFSNSSVKKKNFFNFLPKVLHCYWNVDLLNTQLFGVVWPRKMSLYSNRVITDFMNQLRKYSITTISWWAEWVDMLCHRLSIEEWVPTIVVLGSWLSYAFQSRKRSFLHYVVDNNGLILSQFELGRTPAYWTFPQRNKLLASLATRIFIPWWAMWSWTMITAKYAEELWTRIYTVPWSIYDSLQEGTNQWIASQTMTPIENFETFFSSLSYESKNYWQDSLFSCVWSDAQEIYHLIWKECSFDDLSAKTWWDTGRILVAVSSLELWGYIYQPLQGEYVKK